LPAYIDTHTAFVAAILGDDEDIRFTGSVYGKTIFDAFGTGGILDQVNGLLRAYFDAVKT